MKNILLPIDLSENSRNAVNYAMQLFKNSECNFYFFNSYSPSIYSYEYQLSAGIYGSDIPKIVQENNEKKVLTFVNEVMSNYNNSKHKFTTIVQCNLFTDGVDDMVKAHNIDVIVMGTKGVTSSSSVIFGTNTIHVINKRFCPVIAVPEDYEFKPPKDILFPSDFNVSLNEQHTKTIKNVSQQFNSKVHVLHIYFGGLNSNQRTNKNSLKELMSGVVFDFVDIEDKEITTAVFEYQNKHDVDLLVMVNNKHLFFENLFFTPTISKIAMELKSPFLVVPA